MAQIGNKINSGLNGEWAKHVRWFEKRITAGIRRIRGKEIIYEELNPKNDDSDLAHDIMIEVTFDNHMADNDDYPLLFCGDAPVQKYPIEELLKNAA